MGKRVDALQVSATLSFGVVLELLAAVFALFVVDGQLHRIDIAGLLREFGLQLLADAGLTLREEGLDSGPISTNIPDLRCQLQLTLCSNNGALGQDFGALLYVLSDFATGGLKSGPAITSRSYGRLKIGSLTSDTTRPLRYIEGWGYPPRCFRLFLNCLELAQRD